MRKLSLLLSLCTISFLSFSASGQSPNANDPFFGQTDNGQTCHVVPTTDALERHFGKKPSLAKASKTAAVYPPSYGSGLLLGSGAPEIPNAAFQAIYWNSSVAASTSTSNGYATVQNQVDGFVTDFADNQDWDNSTTDDYTIIQQYGTDSSTPIAPTLGLNPLNSGSAYVDTQADVGTITDAQIQTYIAGLLSAGKLPVNSNTIYGVFFPSGTSVQLSSSEASCTYFCAYHSGFYYNNQAIIYAVFPYPDCGGCNPWNYAAADMLTMFIGHETRESVTDAYGAWRDSQGYEADDKCAWSNLYRTSNGNFFVQPEFSNGGNVTASGFTATYPGPGCVVPNASSGPLSITGPASLPAGTVGVAYTPTTVTATGGTGPYSWSATGLPAGLLIGVSTGTISGTPTTNTGSPFSVTVTVTDNTSATANQVYTLTINLPPPLSITGPASLPAGTVGAVYPATTVTATGGVTPYTWSATGLPTGLSIGPSTGTLSGTPTASGGFSVTVTVTDSASHSTNQVYPLTINPPPPLSITSPASLPNGTVNVTYTSTTVTATGGVPPYSWSATGLPAGLSVGGSTGTISGKPTASGNFSVTVTVTDSVSNSTNKLYSLTISAAPDFTISALPPNASVKRGGKATYTVTVGSLSGFTGSVSLSASGGPSKATYGFSPSSVTPPSNSSGNSTLTITTSSRGGTGTFTVTIKGTYSAGRKTTVTHTTTVTLTTTP